MKSKFKTNFTSLYRTFEFITKNGHTKLIVTKKIEINLQVESLVKMDGKGGIYPKNKNKNKPQINGQWSNPTLKQQIELLPYKII